MGKRKVATKDRIDAACDSIRDHQTHTSATISRLLAAPELAIALTEAWIRAGVPGARAEMYRRAVRSGAAFSDEDTAAAEERLREWIECTDWAAVCVVLRSVVLKAPGQGWAHPGSFRR